MNGGTHETVLRNHDFNNIQSNDSHIGCLRMLKSGRVDLTPSAAGSVSDKLRKAGISRNQIRQTPVVLIESEGYIAFSRNAPGRLSKNGGTPYPA